MLSLLLRLCRLWRHPTPPARAPVPDFIEDIDPTLFEDAELIYTNTVYSHVIAHFDACLRLPAADPSHRLRPDR